MNNKRNVTLGEQFHYGRAVAVLKFHINDRYVGRVCLKPLKGICAGCDDCQDPDPNVLQSLFDLKRD